MLICSPAGLRQWRQRADSEGRKKCPCWRAERRRRRRITKNSHLSDGNDSPERLWMTISLLLGAILCANFFSFSFLSRCILEGVWNFWFYFKPEKATCCKHLALPLIIVWPTVRSPTVRQITWMRADSLRAAGSGGRMMNHFGRERETSLIVGRWDE